MALPSSSLSTRNPKFWKRRIVLCQVPGLYMACFDCSIAVDPARLPEVPLTVWQMRLAERSSSPTVAAANNIPEGTH